VDRLYAELVGAALIIIVGIGLWVHHNDVEQAKGAAECQAKVTETQDRANADAKERNAAYELQLLEADKAKADALATLPPAIHTPVFVHLPGTLCPDAPGSVSQADSVHPDPRGNGSGPGERDIRPGVEAFKMRYGKSLLDCQNILSKWPP